MSSVEITKSNIFVLILAISLLGSLFIVQGFNENFNANPGTAGVFGHSPDEIIVDIGGVQKGLQDAIDDGTISGAAVTCGIGEVALGGECEDLPICRDYDALGYNGTDFVCKGTGMAPPPEPPEPPEPPPQPTLKWTKVCNSRYVNYVYASCSNTNCGSVGAPYGENLRFFRNTANNQNLLCYTSLVSYTTTCGGEDSVCGSEGQYCVPNPSGWGQAMVSFYNCCGIYQYGLLYNPGSTSIYKCIMR